MSFWLKTILIGLMLAALIGVVTVFAGQTGVTTQLNHLSQSINFVVAAAERANDVFPVNDLLLAVGSVFAIEGLIMLWKIGGFFIKHFH